MKVFVIIPAYNEASVVANTVGEVSALYQAVVVNDGSSDDTARLANEAGAIVLSHAINRGQGAALQTGIEYALNQGVDIVVTFDADGQLSVADIKELIKPIEEGMADIVLGSRFLGDAKSLPAARSLVLKIAIALTRFYTGLKVTDTHNGLRAFSAKAAKQLDIRQDGMAHASEIIEHIKKYNWRFVEIPMTMIYTEYSLNKGQKLSGALKIVWDMILSRVGR
jgi:glycosyltransferase involved in cell wall biosynthesis